MAVQEQLMRKLEIIPQEVTKQIPRQDFPSWITQEQVRQEAMRRIQLVLKSRQDIDDELDGVMEGWRLSRLPRIDRDILRLAVVDLRSMNTPASVACSEAVELANRYSDAQGRRMINGVLRRLQNATA